MFQQFKNIDTAFKYIRLIALLSIACSFIFSFFVIVSSNNKIARSQGKVLVIANGKALEAFATPRNQQWPVEIRDHVKMFHFYLQTLSPDEKAITGNINKALSLADKSALDYYENLKEDSYYSNLISANISQQIEMDSIAVNIESEPWNFIYYGKLKLIRSTNIVTRSLISKGNIRILPQISDDNPHGLMIERWLVVDNKDLTEEKR